MHATMTLPAVNSHEVTITGELDPYTETELWTWQCRCPGGQIACGSSVSSIEAQQAVRAHLLGLPE